MPAKEITRAAYTQQPRQVNHYPKTSAIYKWLTRLAVFLASTLVLPVAAEEKIAWLWDHASVPAWSKGHVAMVVEHIHLTGNEIRRRPRLDRPQLSLSNHITPLIHVEISVVRPPANIEQSRQTILEAVQRAAKLSTSGWVQLDMEARPSHRMFYLQLVKDIKSSLSPDIRLSVTALSWWCRSSAWLDGIAADEVVPMMFRLGKETAVIKKIWTSHPEKLHPRCRSGAIGQAQQEPLDESFTNRYEKRYYFDAKHWRN